MINTSMCGNFWTWIDVQVRDGSSSPHNHTDLQRLSVEDSVSHILMQKWSVTSREFLASLQHQNSLVYRPRRSLLSQESVSRGTQSDIWGRVLTLLPRFLEPSVRPSPRSSTSCSMPFTPTAVKSMLSSYHVSYMGCAMQERREGGKLGKLLLMAVYAWRTFSSRSFPSSVVLCKIR